MSSKDHNKFVHFNKTAHLEHHNFIDEMGTQYAPNYLTYFSIETNKFTYGK